MIATCSAGNDPKQHSDMMKHMMSHEKFEPAEGRNAHEGWKYIEDVKATRGVEGVLVLN